MLAWTVVPRELRRKLDLLSGKVHLPDYFWNAARRCCPSLPMG